jgi:hypothetical protein
MIFSSLSDTDCSVGAINLLSTTTPWPESASELYRLNGHRLSAKLVPTFVISVKEALGRILEFLDRSNYFFSQLAPQLLKT